MIFLFRTLVFLIFCMSSKFLLENVHCEFYDVELWTLLSFFKENWTLLQQELYQLADFFDLLNGLFLSFLGVDLVQCQHTDVGLFWPNAKRHKFSGALSYMSFQIPVEGQFCLYYPITSNAIYLKPKALYSLQIISSFTSLFLSNSFQLFCYVICS